MKAVLGGLILLVFSLQASATILTHIVDGTDNLYYTDWGHPYTDALGDGTAASAVSSYGTPFDFAGGSLIEVATGSVVDAGPTATGPDGVASLFRDLPVYSLIGVWSSTGNSITAIGSAFFIGSSATLIAPNVSNAYLFLGENDGIFSDNSGYYSVTIDYTPVPAPATFLVFALGLAMLLLTKARLRPLPID